MSLAMLVVIIALGVFLWYPANDFATEESTFSPVESFEANFYEYLSLTLGDIASQADSSSQVSKTKIQKLADEGIQMIDEFTAENQGSLSEDDIYRLTQLRFYVYSSIAIDEPLTRKALSELPSNEGKLSLFYSYIESFTAPKTRPNTPDAVFFDYLDAQDSWGTEYDPFFQDRKKSLVFKSDPINKTIPNFFKNVNDINGEPLDLDLFKGQYVLVDFWATWCLPCIAELPYLVEAYQRFSSKKFEIISISLDENELAFRDFIKDRDLSWRQYYDGEGFRGELVQKYGVTGIPTLYLVDPQGKVVAYNFNGEELIRQLEQHIKS